MPAGTWFWVIYVLFLIGAFFIWFPFPPESWRPAGATLVLFVLVGLLGYKVFGGPVQ